MRRQNDFDTTSRFDSDALSSQFICDNFSDVQNLRGGCRLFLGRFLCEHPHAKGTSRSHGSRSRRFKFAVAIGRHPLSTGLFFFPELSSTRPAAKAVSAVSIRLVNRGTDGFNDLAGLIIDSVVPSQIARIVVGDLTVRARLEPQLAGLDELVDKFAVMLDNIVATELGVLVPKSMEAVGTGGDDEISLQGVERADIF